MNQRAKHPVKGQVVVQHTHRHPGLSTLPRPLVIANNKLFWLVTLLPPPKKEVMFSVWSVCLSVCPSDYSQTCERILTKCFGGVGHGSRTKWYNFGGDPDHASDPGVQSPKSRSSGSAEVCAVWAYLVVTVVEMASELQKWTECRENTSQPVNVNAAECYSLTELWHWLIVSWNKCALSQMFTVLRSCLMIYRSQLIHVSILMQKYTIWE